MTKKKTTGGIVATSGRKYKITNEPVSRLGKDDIDQFIHKSQDEVGAGKYTLTSLHKLS